MKKRILLVEDEKIFSNFVTELMADYEVVTAVDGIYGLKIGRLQKPDLIIIDLNLPRMNGEELIGRLKDDPELCRIPVVVISGTFARRYEGERSETLRADAVFSKPFELARFREVIQKLTSAPPIPPTSDSAASPNG